MLFSEFRIKKDDIIQPEKLKQLAELNPNFEFVSFEKLYIKNYIQRNTPKIYFMLGDYPFVYDIFKHLNHTTIIATNNQVISENVYSVPIGVTNTSHCNIIGNLDVIVEQFKKPKCHSEQLLYMNFNIRNDNSFSERNSAILHFENKDWVTRGKFERTHEGHKRFIEEIYNHKFILCPWGAGIDTHRLWMSLYLGSIPITKYHETYYHFRHLPIVFVNDWKEVTKELLIQKYDEIMKNDYDLSILGMEFWRKQFE